MAKFRAYLLSLSAFLLFPIILAVAGQPAAARDVTGLNVRMVDFGPGAFVQTGPKKWAEVNKTTWKDAFHFDETARSAVSVKLHRIPGSAIAWDDGTGAVGGTQSATTQDNSGPPDGFVWTFEHLTVKQTSFIAPPSVFLTCGIPETDATAANSAA